MKISLYTLAIAVLSVVSATKSNSQCVFDAPISLSGTPQEVCPTNIFKS